MSAKYSTVLAAPKRVGEPLCGLPCKHKDKLHPTETHTPRRGAPMWAPGNVKAKYTFYRDATQGVPYAILFFIKQKMPTKFFVSISFSHFTLHSSVF